MTGRSIITACSAGLVLISLAAVALAAIPAGNLIRNPGGEGTQGGTIITQDVKPSGWTTSGGPGDRGITVMRYGAHAYFPERSVAASIGGGANFFAGGQNIQVSSAMQTLDVGGAAAEIDAGGVRVCLSGYLGGSRTFPDTARVELQMLSADDQPLGRLRIGPVTAVHRKGKTTLLRRAAEGTVPRSTRQLRVELVAQHAGGGPNYGYADNISVALARGACEPVLAVRCTGGALLATVTPSAVARTQRVRFAVRGAKGSKQITDTRAPYSARFPMAGLTGRLTVTATVTQAGAAPIVLTKKSRRC